MIHRCSTYDPLSNLLRLFLVLKPYTHIPVDKHSVTILVDEDVVSTEIAMKHFCVIESIGMTWRNQLARVDSEDWNEGIRTNQGMVYRGAKFLRAAEGPEGCTNLLEQQTMMDMVVHLHRLVCFVGLVGAWASDCVLLDILIRLRRLHRR